MDDAARIWREKSDDELIEAAAELDQYTESGKAIIRAELKRRGLEDPVEQEGAAATATDEPELQCLRCKAPMRLIESKDDTVNVDWALVPRGSRFDESVPLSAYVCSRCGHVELFMDAAESDQPE